MTAEEEADYRAHASGSALELASTAFLATEVDLSGDIADYDLTYAIAVRGYLEALQRAVRVAKKQLDQLIATQLGPKGGIRLGDQFIREGQGGKWKVKDPAALRSWIAENQAWGMVNVAVEGAVTVTRLREYLIATGADAKTAETFMEREPDGAPITVLPLDKAPKFAAKLKDGERYVPKPRLEGK